MSFIEQLRVMSAHQEEIAEDLEVEYERSDGNLSLLQEREYERGRATGIRQALALYEEVERR